MANFKFDSAGVNGLDQGSIKPQPTAVVGTPAVVIGTARKGPAFVPVSFGSFLDFINVFGYPNVSGSIENDERLTDYGPFAMQEWLRNSAAGTYVRVLGTGNGKKRSSDGTVTNAGFTVGEEQPDYLDLDLSGSLSSNPYANEGGVLGRTYFLGCFMSESAGSTVFSSAGLQGQNSNNGITTSAVPIVRGVLMAPSGVILRLSSSAGLDSSQPASSLVADDSTSNGTTLGSIKFFDTNSGDYLHQFVMLLNGHKGSQDYPNVITASFDMHSPLYITKVFNMSASLLQSSGHYLAAHWDIHPAIANVTGVGVVSAGAGAPDDSNRIYSTERSAFLITSSLQRDVGSSTVPNYESFRDRFSHASSPWFISQKIHGKHINLFKLHALDAGQDVSDKYKIIIHDITPSVDGYGTFSLTLRNIDDFNEITPAVESYTSISLNPSSDRYISKIIGDRFAYFDFDRPDNNQKIVVQGNYEVQSRYVRVEVSNEVESQTVPPEVLPLGFRGLSHIVTSGSLPLSPLGGSDASALTDATILRNAVVSPITFADNILENKNGKLTPSTKNRWGVKFDHTIDLSNKNNSKLYDKSIDSFAKYFPNNSTTNINFSVADNQGTPDTPELGIIDADRFCNNLFTLENIKISGTKINDWENAVYVRNGEINADDFAQTRPVNIDDFYDTTSKNFLSFQTLMQGGFDGVNIFEPNEFNLTDNAVMADMYDPNRGKAAGSTVASYLKALEIVGNVVNLEMQLLAIPGIRTPIITDAATNTIEDRYDGMYVMDIEQVNSNGIPISISKLTPYSNESIPDVQRTIDLFSSRYINSSFTSAYFPDVSLSIDANRYNLDSIEVPPSVVALGALSLNDSLGYPWLAPVGINRGALPTTLSTLVKLKEPELNSLYSNDINPLYAPSNVGGQGSGVVIWGQKTLNKSISSLERINVRRMLLEVRRQVRDLSIRLLFEPNIQSVKQRLSSDISSRLSNIQSLFGLRNYSVEIDLSQTSQSDLDNHTIKGKIYVQPTRTIEFMSLDFIVSNGLTSEI